MIKTTHALPVLAFQETDFLPKRVVIPRLRDTGTSFLSGSKISIKYSNRRELAPV